MNVIHGDLLELALAGHFDVIVHGCNCQCVMGKGIAKTIRQKFPEAYAADRATQKSDRKKLGTISLAEISRDAVRFTVVNAYIQWHWRGRGVKVDYEALRSAMHLVNLQFANLRVGLPLIGAGLAGGDWTVIAEIIKAELTDVELTVVKYYPKRT